MALDTKNFTEQAKKILQDILYLTLATCDKQNQPWNSPVYSAFDEKYNFYWVSWADNQHSKNIRENPNVFGVVYDSTVPEGTGVGVYMQGKAYQLGIADIVEMAHACLLMYKRKSKKPRSAEEFLGLFPRRIYKFVPEKIWVNGGSDIQGNYIDERVEITSLLS